MLPVFRTESAIVVEERWHGRLWSAVPHRVIASDSSMLITQVPVGTPWAVATNRGLPEAEGLTRDERKHLALKTLVARPLLAEDWLDKVFVFEPGRWARVNLAWDPAADHEFLGWYVNFELPVTATDAGLWGKDLVLDLFVYSDGSWDWKDAEEFDRAIDEGVLAPELRPILEEEAERVLADRDQQRGGFDPELIKLRPDSGAAPVLPPEYLPDGERWQRTYPVLPIPPAD